MSKAESEGLAIGADGNIPLEIFDSAGNLLDELFVNPENPQFASGFITALSAHGLIDTEEEERLHGVVAGAADPGGLSAASHSPGRSVQPSASSWRVREADGGFVVERDVTTRVRYGNTVFNSQAFATAVAENLNPPADPDDFHDDDQYRIR